MRKRIYASVSAVAAALSMSGCFDACNLVENHVLEVAPNPARAGEEVTFTARIRMDRGTPTDVEFDLDGDGTLETHTRPVAAPTPLQTPFQYSATVRRSYASPRTIAVRSVVRAEAKGQALFSLKPFSAFEIDIVEYDAGPSVILEVQQGPNQPPMASFTVTPNPVVPEGQVTYDASESMDPDGQVVRYEWDLDGNGTYETDTGSSPTTTQMEPGNGFEGTYTVGLRVTDDRGGSGTTTREVIVQHPTRIASPSKLAQRLVAAKSFEFPPRVREVEPGEMILNGDELIIEGRIDRGRFPASMFPASLRRGKRKVRWVSGTDAVIDTVAGSGTGRGYSVLRFPTGGRACMAYRVDSPPSGKADGSMRIVGGVGRAAGLRGRGMGEGRVTEEGVAIAGRLDLDFGGKRNFRLGRSDCAPLLRHSRG